MPTKECPVDNNNFITNSKEFYCVVLQAPYLENIERPPVDTRKKFAFCASIGANT